jgi:hypothetical protein
MTTRLWSEMNESVPLHMGDGSGLAPRHGMPGSDEREQGQAMAHQEGQEVQRRKGRTAHEANPEAVW